MKKTKYYTLFMIALVGIKVGSFANNFPPQEKNKSPSNEQVSIEFTEDGYIKQVTFAESGNVVYFGNDYFQGPSWYYEDADTVAEASVISFDGKTQKSKYDDLSFSITYQTEEDKLLVIAEVTNTGKVPIQPTRIGLRLGINTYMDKYPEWEQAYFPTLMRGEKTHFWGYFMSPLQKIVTVSSPDASASWSHDYPTGWNEGPYYYQGHRISSANLDFINALPLPSRHPQNAYQLLPGETKIYRVFYDEVEKLEDVLPTVSESTDAPMIDIALTGFEINDEVSFDVIGGEAEVTLIAPNGKAASINKKGEKYIFSDTKEPGTYTILATNAKGKHTTGTFYVRQPYSWYMTQAMKAVMDYPPKASFTHCESWYGFYTSFSGGKYFDDNPYVLPATDEFAKVYPAIFDTLKLEPKKHHFRIQNVSSIIGILVDRYQLFGEEKDLKDAIGFAEFLLKAQYEDGAYRASASSASKSKEDNLKVDGAYRAKPTHYTCVIYIAKSLMELLEVLETAGKEYRTDYKKIYASVEKAIDELERSRSNIETEGTLTFEDGMISCSSLQLGMFALMQTKQKEKDRYTEAALDMLNQHDCLEQLVIPDARQRSGSLRFWEAQYDVLIGQNFFNSTHGWSSWTTYANYYAYLLTGEEKYLVRTFNGLDAAMQSIDLDGTMRWSFTPNPYIQAQQLYENIPSSTPMNVVGMHYNVGKYETKEYVLGEQYIGMVSNWFFGNSNDNDVHEHFKALEEIALGKAYVLEKADGSLMAFNCSAEMKNGKLVVKPSEKMIAQVHFNLKSDKKVAVAFAKGAVETELAKGMRWMYYQNR